MVLKAIREYVEPSHMVKSLSRCYQTRDQRDFQTQVKIKKLDQTNYLSPLNPLC